MIARQPSGMAISSLDIVVPSREPRTVVGGFVERATKPWRRIFSKIPMDVTEVEPSFLLKVAIHEAGHVAATVALGHGESLTRAAILPRAGASNGMVQRQPRPHFMATASKRELLETITIKLAGRAAEESFFGPDDVTLGSCGDLAAANEIARDMITIHGFGTSLGFVVLDTKGKNLPQEVILEIKELLKLQYEHALALVQENREAIKAVAQRLLYEGELSGVALRECFSNIRAPSLSNGSPDAL